MSEAPVGGGTSSTADTPRLLNEQMLASTVEIDRVIELLSSYESHDAGQRDVRDDMLRFANEFGDQSLHRTCEPGHFTASAIVVERGTDRFIVLFHAKLEKWLQPGGHVDGSSNLPAAALREAKEETGIVGLQVALPVIDLDIHEVRPPKEAPHLHYDVRFVVLAPTGSLPVRNHESRDIRWVTFDDLDSLNVDVSVTRLAQRGLELARTIEAQS